jgi:hypothetical protein
VQVLQGNAGAIGGDDDIRVGVGPGTGAGDQQPVDPVGVPKPARGTNVKP